jgi:hypothetical protein
MRCVVCSADVHPGQAHYANAWETTRKKSPCCSVRCSSRFNPDVHWIPDPLPEPASDADQLRLLKVVQHRLRDGDRPTVVLREMLLAGVNPPGLRKLLIEAQLAGSRSRKNAKELSGMGTVVGFLTGHFSVFGSRDKRDPGSLEDALVELEKWEAHAASS